MPTNPYESDKLLAEYLLFHFGADEEILSAVSPASMRDALGFAMRTVKHFADQPTARALDLGCAVGRSSFELSKNADEVIGIDFSASFITAAEKLRAGETLPYSRLEEGNVRTGLIARAPADARAERITFQTGDAMHLPNDLGIFDRVHAANLLCRLPEPKLLLDRLPSLVRSGGELVLATPCTWLEEYTPPQNWPTGRTFDWLQEQLDDSFTLERNTDEPFLIRETARKFQYTFSLVTTWRRR